MARPWTEQKYVKAPALSNVRLKVPERWITEFGPPASNVTLCGFRPVHVHVTVAFFDESRMTVTTAGLKKLSPIATEALVDSAGALR